MEANRNINRRIRDFMKVNGISEEVLAHFLGYSKVQLRESLDSDSVDMKMLEKIAGFLRVSPYSFFRSTPYDSLYKFKPVEERQLSEIELKLAAAYEEIDMLKDRVKEQSGLISSLKQKLKL